MEEEACPCRVKLLWVRYDPLCASSRTFLPTKQALLIAHQGYNDSAHCEVEQVWTV
jgi:hypothetical protein